MEGSSKAAKLWWYSRYGLVGIWIMTENSTLVESLEEALRRANEVHAKMAPWPVSQLICEEYDGSPYVRAWLAAIDQCGLRIEYHQIEQVVEVAECQFGEVTVTMPKSLVWLTQKPASQSDLVSNDGWCIVLGAPPDYRQGEPIVWQHIDCSTDCKEASA